MKRLLILATVVAMALAMVPMTAFAKNNTSGFKSTGGVGYTSGAGHDASASFNAHETPNNLASDAKGQVNFEGVGPLATSTTREPSTATTGSMTTRLASQV